MRSQIVPNLDGPGHICFSSDVTPLSASASARSFSKQPAWLLIFINNTDPGHKRSSLSRGSRISKCTMSRGCGWKSDLPQFMRISRRTRQSMKINRSHWSGNRSRTRLKKYRRLAASGPLLVKRKPVLLLVPKTARGVFSQCLMRPAPILSVRTHALPSVLPTKPGNVYCLASCWY
jgi:hypothetical protein